ncbi:hypothetical protein [Aeromicrobium sp.]|uniref:hypothetical protein n=1 Tax=Aeromicrobium sp. TaxID=1871063 RepID=UPI0030C5745F
MSLEWYRPLPLRVLDLDALGVRICPAEGTPMSYVDPGTGRVVCEVGHVTVFDTGSVQVVPRCGVSPSRAIPDLLTSAEEGALGRVSTAEGWFRGEGPDGSYWFCCVLVTVPPKAEVSVALRRMMSTTEERTQSLPGRRHAS